MISIAALIVFSVFVSNEVSAMNNKYGLAHEQAEQCLAIFPREKILTQMFRNQGYKGGYDVQEVEVFLCITNIVQILAGQEIPPSTVVSHLKKVLHVNYQALENNWMRCVHHRAARNFVYAVIARVLEAQPEALDEFNRCWDGESKL